jgi:hypothetical protein
MPVNSIGSGISERFGEYGGRKGSFGYHCEPPYTELSLPIELFSRSKGLQKLAIAWTLFVRHERFLPKAAELKE